MVSYSGFVEGGKQLLNILPVELAKDIIFIIKILGGLFAVYLIFLGIRLYWQRKQMKMIKEIYEDIKEIKKKLKIKNRLED